MKEQNYHNHTRVYPTHHLIFYPLMGLLISAMVYHTITDAKNHMLWTAITILFLVCTWLSFMMRQHYALTTQNRIVRLEMRLRYFELTGKRFQEIERQLAFGQIAALRFAGDEELIQLLERTLKENLSPTAIKKAVTNWQPDHMRV